MPFILPGNVGSATAATGFNVTNSCRFNPPDAPYFAKDPTEDGNQRTFTISVWLKMDIHLSGASHFVFDTGTNSNHFKVYFTEEPYLKVAAKVSGSTVLELIPTQAFRDPTAWFHLYVAIDTTQSTNTNRAKIYINGIQVSLATATYPDQNTDFENQDAGEPFEIGTDSGHASDAHFDGYMAEYMYVDGAVQAISDFGEFDEDSPTVWKPKDISAIDVNPADDNGNGFYLDFKVSGNLGNDVGVNAGTDFAENNIVAVDQSTDTCTNNFATFNPLSSVTDAPTFSEGNLQIAIGNAGRFGAATTIGMTAGKWYCEIKLVATSDDDGGVGIISDFDDARQDLPVGESANTYGYKEKTGNKINANSEVSYGDAFNSAGDILGIALDLDNLKIYFSKNGTFQASGDPTSGATGTGAAYTVTAPASTEAGAYFFVGSCYSGSQSNTYAANFGSPPYAVSSGNADGNGFGNFEYAPPSGYLALCTKNLGSDGG